jgi:SAM-dependent methyltransferase
MKQELIQDIIQWDVRSWSKILPYWEQQVDWKSVHQCLEIGGREGGLSLWLGLKGKQTLCSDLKNTEETAARLNAKYQLGPVVTYEDINATSIPYENHFDLIVFKSILGGIGYGGDKAEQQKVFDQIHKALKPGGKVLFAENLTATLLHCQLRKRFVKWGSGWRYVSVQEMQEFLDKFSSADIRIHRNIRKIGKTKGLPCPHGSGFV